MQLLMAMLGAVSSSTLRHLEYCCGAGGACSQSRSGCKATLCQLQLPWSLLWSVQPWQFASITEGSTDSV